MPEHKRFGAAGGDGCIPWGLSAIHGRRGIVAGRGGGDWSPGAFQGGRSTGFGRVTEGRGDSPKPGAGRLARILSLGILVAALAVASWARAGTQATPDGDPSALQKLEEQNREYFTDLPVFTHEGTEVRFYSDLLKGRRVIISFFYVNCPTAQPSIITFFKLQKELGEKLGEEIVLLTISVDPDRDDLKAVQELAGRYNPRKGWYFVTGSPASMNVINRKLGNTLSLPEGHLRQYLLGNLRTGHWMRLVDTAPTLALRDGLESLGEPGR